MRAICEIIFLIQTIGYEVVEEVIYYSFLQPTMNCKTGFLQSCPKLTDHIVWCKYSSGAQMTVRRAFLEWPERDFVWISRERQIKSSPQKNSRWFWGAVGEDFKPQIRDMRCESRPFTNRRFRQKRAAEHRCPTACPTKILSILVNSVPRGWNALWTR